MDKKVYELMATSTFGLESIVKKELFELGYDVNKVENGRIEFTGDELDIARTNLWLSCADRILIKALSFKTKDFDELFKKIMAYPWSGFIKPDSNIVVKARSKNSKLFSTPTLQSVGKKAILDSLRKTHGNIRFPETGDDFTIEIMLLNDEAIVAIDTSGDSLNKRGYRKEAGEAPLRETLAAALVTLVKWNSTVTLLDPFCGSGTIAIEAAMRARNIAPGSQRYFAAEKWLCSNKTLWRDARDEARKARNKDAFKILASDIDPHVLSIAKDNAKRATVDENIEFSQKDFNTMALQKDSSVVVITNPPYGVRFKDKGEAEIKKIYQSIALMIKNNPNSQLNIFSGIEDFEILIGVKASRNRKLYNGNIRCYLYQYEPVAKQH